ncbi:MAG: LPS export ABC transporter permease LptF [Candidatus Methylomirabilales bacterium]
MKIIDRYIGRELLISMSLGLAIATFALMTKPMLKLMDLFITKLVPVGIIARLFLYVLPPLFVLTTPMALLLAVIATYSRIAAEHELTALKAAGCSLYRLALPAFGVGIVALCFTAFNSIYGVPWAGQAFRDLLFTLARTRATIGIRERVFNDDFHGLILYTNRINEASGVMEGVFVVDNQNEQHPRVIIARRGRIAPDERQNVVRLALEDGSTHITPKDKQDLYQMLKFENVDLALSVSDQTILKKDKHPREMTIPELFATIQQRAAAGKPTADLMVSFHQRFAAPAACLVFILLGTPLAIRVRRSGKGISLGITLVLVAIYYVLMIAGQGLGKHGRIPPLLASWLPNLVLGGLGLFLFTGGNRESWLPLPLVARRKRTTVTPNGTSVS